MAVRAARGAGVAGEDVRPAEKPGALAVCFRFVPGDEKAAAGDGRGFENFFATGAEGRLQNGDNIGVWTYDQKMHGGQFPLTIWKPEQAAALTTNLIGFLRARAFTADSKMAVLQPSLDSVISNSERLTIVIFCDGESGLVSTPYDTGINQSFLDGRAETQKIPAAVRAAVPHVVGKIHRLHGEFPAGRNQHPAVSRAAAARAYEHAAARDRGCRQAAAGGCARFGHRRHARRHGDQSIAGNFFAGDQSGSGRSA